MKGGEKKSEIGQLLMGPCIGQKLPSWHGQLTLDILHIHSDCITGSELYLTRDGSTWQYVLFHGIFNIYKSNLEYVLLTPQTRYMSAIIKCKCNYKYGVFILSLFSRVFVNVRVQLLNQLLVNINYVVCSVRVTDSPVTVCKGLNLLNK